MGNYSTTGTGSAGIKRQNSTKAYAPGIGVLSTGQTRAKNTQTVPMLNNQSVIDEFEKDRTAIAKIKAQYEQDMKSYQDPVATMPKSSSLIDRIKSSAENVKYMEAQSIDMPHEPTALETRIQSYRNLKQQEQSMRANETWHNSRQREIENLPEEDRALLSQWSDADRNITDAADRAAKMYLPKHQLEQRGYDAKQLQEWEDQMNWAANRERAAQQQTKNYRYADEEPISASAQTLWEKPVGSVLSAADYAKQGLRRLWTGSEAPLDTNTWMQSPQQDVDDIRGRVSSNLQDYEYLSPEESKKYTWLFGEPENVNKTLGQIASGTYNAGMGAMDTAVAAAVPFGSGVPQALMGFEAGSKAMTEALNNGAGNGQAAVYALSAAALEQFFSKFSIENLRGLSNESVVRNMETAMRNIGRSVGVNAGEQFFSSIAGTVSEGLILQNHSELYQKWYEEYVMADQLGMDDAQARKFANTYTALWLAKKTGMDTMSGAVQGAVHGSIANLGGVYNARTIDQYENELAGSNRTDFGELEPETRLQEARMEKKLQRAYPEMQDGTNWLYGNLAERENLSSFDRLMAVYDDNYVKKLKKQGKNNDDLKMGELSLRSISDEGIIRNKDHWENGKLKPNSTYQAGEHEYLYQTNDAGWIDRVIVPAIQEKKHEGRERHDPKTLGKMGGDHAGHMIADLFGGSPKLDNLVSQASYVNQSTYTKLENEWARAVQDAQRTMVDIKLHYSDDTGRPAAFQVRYKIGDGKIVERFISNQNKEK